MLILAPRWPYPSEDVPKTLNPFLSCPFSLSDRLFTHPALPPLFLSYCCLTNHPNVVAENCNHFLFTALQFGLNSAGKVFCLSLWGDVRRGWGLFMQLQSRRCTAKATWPKMTSCRWLVLPCSSWLGRTSVRRCGSSSRTAYVSCVIGGLMPKEVNGQNHSPSRGQSIRHLSRESCKNHWAPLTCLFYFLISQNTSKKISENMHKSDI